MQHSVWLEDAFDRAKQLYLSCYRSIPKSLERSTAHKLMLAMLNGDERFVEPTPQSLLKLTLQTVKDAVMSQFFGDNMEVSIVGDFTENDIESCILDYLGTVGATKKGWASNNSLTSLPGDLSNCLKLVKLHVEGNKLTILCENNQMSWTTLAELNASKNLLISIPENIGILSRLIRLDLHQNRITSIPSSIDGCSSLTEFSMGSRIYIYSSLSSVVLPQLCIVIDARTNMLSSIPEEIGALTQLGTLDLHSNQLKEFLVEACKLQVSVLDLSNNSLSGLPPEIGKGSSWLQLL
ncbi:hypothetical protein MKW98_008364 [Papaver atlanticum]|uniref:Peptidase M16 C-terminal domain-containing protein n=1 Tax=Papaver atlanticum TaxID=357466 RepID=A0AAD4SFE0_9MAGN|nr:hypothetical protein MKW98_008364 [Papaver atlanticum]